MNKKKKSYIFGLVAEFMAITCLRLKLYYILEKRYKTKVGEVDIIACKGNKLVFIEVKARTDKSNIKEVVSNHQWNRINRAASVFLSRNRKFADSALRFDLMLVTGNLIPRHIKNAWECNSKFL